MSTCGYDGIAIKGTSGLPSSCSTNDVYIVFHANLVGDFKNAAPGTVVCFASSVKLGSATVNGQTCLTLQSGAPAPGIGNPSSITMDPSKAQGVLIGFAVCSCGPACPTGLSPTWSLTPSVTSGSGDFSGANWQWSATAYQVNAVDTSIILLFASNCDGYPISQTQCHLAGGWCGGGANYCGSWCSTQSICPK